MKKIISSILFTLFLGISGAFACDVCQKNQPAVLKNITHGVGPQGNLDYIITWSAAAIVLVALVLSLKYMIKPKENNNSHIKNIVTDEYQ